MFGHGESVLLHRYLGAGRDSHGNVIPSYAPPVTVAGVGVAPGSSSEPRSGGSSRVITGMAIFLPPDVSVNPQDQITVRGQLYMVEGDMSGAWANPFTGWNPGAEVTLKRVTG